MMSNEKCKEYFGMANIKTIMGTCCPTEKRFDIGEMA